MKAISFFVFFFLLCPFAFGDEATEKKITALIEKMTLEEKLGQLTLYSAGLDNTGPTLTDKKFIIEGIKRGRIGSLFNAFTVKFTTDMQNYAVKESRLKIPLLFGFDVIHGYRTIFPVPIAEASSWDIDAIHTSARISAIESAAAGLHWTYAPMVDIARDPRWGRVIEGSGEDTFLGSRIAEARVMGIQGKSKGVHAYQTDELVATVKHYVGYGAAEAGRDYNTVDMSELVLRETYLPPFKAAVDAGVGSVMTAFNEIEGVPASANHFLIEGILRQEWGFKGFVVSDYTSIPEVIAHGFAKDRANAARLSKNAGMDLDMEGGIFNEHLPELIKRDKVNLANVDESVRRILRVKFQLGLFEDPLRYSNADREKKLVFSKEHLAAAHDVARKSIVLLKNDPLPGEKTAVLPLAKNVKSIALIGPLAASKKDMVGSWKGFGNGDDAESLLDGLRARSPKLKINYVEGAKIDGNSETGFENALIAAKNSDLVIAVMGESEAMSGEASSRSDIGLPGVQEKLLKQLHATGKPIVLVLMNGRPMTIEWAAEKIPSILETWFLGTKAGNAIADVLFGDYNPSGKLPMTFPRRVGQIPIYYNHKNTGRPAVEGSGKYTSKYLDVANSPLFYFGHGLSYTKFEYENISVEKITKDSKFASVTVKATVKNVGPVAGTEIAQCYSQEVVGKVTRPVQELKGFTKVTLKPGESRPISFAITRAALSNYSRNDQRKMVFDFNPGEFKFRIGGDSVHWLEAKLEIAE